MNYSAEIEVLLLKFEERNFAGHCTGERLFYQRLSSRVLPLTVQPEKAGILARLLLPGIEERKRVEGRELMAELS